MKLSKHEIEHKGLEGKGHGIVKEGYSLEEQFSTPKWPWENTDSYDS